MKLSSYARRVSASVLPKVDASACLPPTNWSECDCTKTSAGTVCETYDCSTNCANHVTCSPTGASC
jgi:hypothetical protein